MAFCQSYQEVTDANGIFHQYQDGGEYGSGVSFYDFDKDGWDDLSLCRNGSNPMFFKNNQGEFEPINFNIQSSAQMKQITWVDYDNDGDRDLFTTSLGSAFKLYQNGADGSLTDVTTAAGFPSTDYRTYGNSWADYDRDGDLDVYICNYNGFGMGDPNVTNLLYRNEGNGTFTDQTDVAGIGNGNNYTFMSLWIDYNKDLWPDLMVINDRYTSSNALYLNNGNGTFADVTVPSGLQQLICAMSDTGEDYDNDGDLDIYITNTMAVGNYCNQNNGDGTFSNVAENNGTLLNLFSWCAQFIDADNDTWQDLFVCTTPHIGTNGQAQFLRNENGIFTNYTAESGMANEIGWNRGNAIGDMNNDGFPDIFIQASSPNYSSLWKANAGANHWMKAELEGTASNKDGISSWIECYADGHQYVRYTYCGEAYLCQNSSNEFFGLAQNEVVDSLIVRWTSGIVDHWYNIPVDQQLHLVEGTSRKVELSWNSAIVLCEGDSIELSSNEWSSYLWNNTATNPNLFAFNNNPIQLLVTDEWGNQFLSESVQPFFNSPPVMNAIVTSPSCTGFNNGSIELQGDFGPEAPLFYWNNVPLQQTSLTGIPSGVYQYSSTINGCQIEGIVELPEPVPITVTSEVSQPLCAGDVGSILLSITGGVPTYEVSWPDITQDSIPAGDYTLNITDANQCDILHSFEVIEPLPIILESYASNPNCFNSNDGSILLSASGGSGAVQIDTGGLALDSLSSGNYLIIATDENGCSTSALVNLTAPAEITLSLDITPEYSGLTLGNVVAHVTGGIEPYQYEWNGQLSADSTQLLPTGEYTVNIIDASGCTAQMAFTIDLIEEVNEFGNLGVSVFPNPAQQFIHVKLPCNDGGQFYIHDTLGKQIEAGSFQNGVFTIPVSTILPGNYSLRISTKQSQFIQRILIH
jgi:hypothetical protein